jgi:uncharacterized protein (DUF885 family)
VKTDPKYRFKSRDELIKYAEAAVRRAKNAMPKAFGNVPSAPVIVEPYPAFLEKTAPGGQAVPPTADGKPGKYLLNAYKATEQSRAGLESTAFHETYPGHHLQGAVALEKENLHPIQRYFFLSGFGEGWGLYSERLADEMGLFSGDVDRLGCCRTKHCARRGWWWTPGCTRSGGRASRRSTTCWRTPQKRTPARRPRSTGTSPCPVRPPRT